MVRRCCPPKVLPYRTFTGTDRFPCPLSSLRNNGRVNFITFAMTNNENYCLNNLCFVFSARITLSVHEIIESCLAFYNDVDVEKAKAKVYDHLGSTAPTRRGPKKTRSHLEDILEALDKGDENHVSWPHFVASGTHPLPPTLGFRVGSERSGILFLGCRG